MGTDGTRQRILREALALFTARGFADTSMRDLSAALGLTKASFYYHFRSKDELLAELAAPVLADLDRVLDGSTAGLDTDAVRWHVLAGTLDVVERHRAVLSLFVGDVSVHSQHTIGPQVRTVLHRLVDRLAGPAPTPRDVVRANQAMAALRVALDVPADRFGAGELRAEVLAGAGLLLGLESPPEAAAGRGPTREAAPAP